MDISKNFMLLMKNWGYDNEKEFFTELEGFESELKRLQGLEQHYIAECNRMREIGALHRRTEGSYRFLYFHSKSEVEHLKMALDSLQSRFEQMSHKSYQYLKDLNLDE